jgi:hypothetical protein
MLRGVFLFAGGTAVGISLAVPTAYFVDRSHQPSAAKVTSQEQPTTDPAPSRAQEDGARLTGLDARLEALERRSAVGATAAIPSSDTPTLLHPADSKPVLHDSLQARLTSEGVDGTWANRSQSEIEADLSTIATDDGFHVSSVECRTTLCSAHLSWDSFESARASRGQLLTHKGPLNCDRDIYMPQPSEGAAVGAYAADVIYDCEGLRAGVQ